MEENQAEKISLQKTFENGVREGGGGCQIRINLVFKLTIKNNVFFQFIFKTNQNKNERKKFIKTHNFKKKQFLF